MTFCVFEKSHDINEFIELWESKEIGGVNQDRLLLCKVKGRVKVCKSIV